MPYCGPCDEPGEFMTAAQRKRAMATLEGLAEQYAHDLLGDILGNTFGRSAATSSSASTTPLRCSQSTRAST